MGLPTQSPLVPGAAGCRLGDRGIALPAAMFALVTVSILVAGVFAFADLSAKATLNQERATRAMQVADAGLAHTVSLLRGGLRANNFTRILRGSDNAIPTADDSLMTGYGLAAGDQIPLAGKAFQGHTYFVSVRDDPADGDANAATDLNGRVLVRCRAVTSDGATAEVAAIVGAVPMPGIVTDGNLEISSAASISGACGTVHTNGNITGGGAPTAALATATGVVGPGSLSPQLEGQPAVPVPDLTPANFFPAGCAARAGTPWNPTAAQLVAGTTYCVTGDVQLDDDFATMAAKRAVSIIATGSIKISAKPMMRAAHPDGILLMAGGDLDIQGDWGGEGMIYAGGQCYISSKPNINGQLICKNKSPHPGDNSVPANLISGDAIITFDCSTNGFNKRRVLHWYPRIGV